MELLYFILITFGIVLAVLSIQIWFEKEKNIKRLQQDIKREYESIEHTANVFGDEYAAKLIRLLQVMTLRKI